MPFKFTMLFNFQGQGFSETWYHQGGGSLSTLTMTPINNLLYARNSLTAKNVKLVGWRLSDVDNPRQTRSNTEFFTNSGSDPDTVTNAWLAMVKGPDGQGRRQWWIRGVSDESIIWDAASLSFKPTGGFKNKYDAFINIITADPWRIRIATSLKASAKKGAVSGVTVNAVGTVRLAGTGGNFATVTKTAPIIVSGFKGKLHSLNGTYQPTSGAEIANDTVDLLTKSLPNLSASGYTGGAYVRSAEFSYVKPSTSSLVGPRERRVGRAFFVPAGRRSAR